MDFYVSFSLILHFGDCFILKTKQAVDGLLERDIGRTQSFLFISSTYVFVLT